ncbi:16S rRNA (guanine(966)-N(2))-methyltransferase RsmD [Rhodoferax sp. 4810]|uniref:Ribosomal RNA small subunit methyltransferase D n=2 Tax=Thiospirillum jenense TaxID=1653858 RepID=A0A839HHG8_9GAMM|nr:16S rRNA (guanine(966)-N(2))-methyltransferase RsmD [Rhodoferax jenense]MBB1126269.1 16S rRNA (guanine(966)-N(2))-methyltransferase RsmD [Thiospirillum jenense]
MVQDHPGLRPTADRIRETLFNWLAPVITGSRCLDGFAGSGALGFEALSRDAAQVVMCEQSAAVARQLRTTAAALDLTAAVTIHCVDTLRWLTQVPDLPYNIVLLDPPFNADLLPRTCEALATGGWVTAGGYVYLESANPPGLPPLPHGWEWWRQQRAGQVAFGLAVVTAVD